MGLGKSNYLSTFLKEHVSDARNGNGVSFLSKYLVETGRLFVQSYVIHKYTN